MNGVFQMPFAEYKKANGINHSLLKVMIDESPANAKAELDGIAERTETPDMRFGSLFHAWVLEPEKAESEFHYRPDVYGDDNKPWNGNAKICQAWITEHSDKPIVTRDSVRKVKDMAESLRANQSFVELFGGKSEQSLFATDASGTQLKARLDRFSEVGNVILDLKTCQSANPDEFEKVIWDRRYFSQAAFYIDLANMLGFKKSIFVFAAIEKKPPYVVSMFRLSKSTIRAGRMLYKKQLAALVDCMKSDKWPTYTKGIQEIELPIWAQKQFPSLF